MKAAGVWMKPTVGFHEEDVYKEAIKIASRNISMKECSLAHELDAVSTNI